MKYRIKPGFSFRDSDNSVKTGGDEIDLDEEGAAKFADQVEPLTPPTEPTHEAAH